MTHRTHARIMTRVVLAIATLLAIAPPALAQSESAEQRASTLTRRLMSPYCPGLLLADCGSQGARELRAEILHRLQAGEFPDAIEDDLASRFGPTIRTVPAFGGVGLIVWLAPLAAGLTGLGLAALVVRRAASREGLSGAAEHGEASSDIRLDERLQHELDALD